MRSHVVSIIVPRCWRCEESIEEFYALSNHEVVRSRFATFNGYASLPDSFLCADCTDEMAEMNRP